MESRIDKTNGESKAENESKQTASAPERDTKNTSPNRPAAVVANQLHPIAQQMLETVLEETGHSLCLDDFGELFNAHELAKLQTESHVRDGGGLLSLPVVAGDVTLYPITIGVGQWYDDYPSDWYGEDDDFMRQCALAFALTFGADRHEELLSISAQTTFESKMHKWRRRLKISANDLMDAVQLCIPDPECQATRASGEFGEVVGLLVREYGNSPEYWMWDADIGLCSAMIDDFVERQFQAADAQMQMTRNTGKKVIHSTSASQRKIAAIKQMRDLRNRLLKDWGPTEEEK